MILQFVHNFHLLALHVQHNDGALFVSNNAFELYFFFSIKYSLLNYPTAIR